MGGQIFAVYLITDAVDVWSFIFYPIIYLMKQQANVVLIAVSIVGYAVVLMAGGIILDAIRKRSYDAVCGILVDLWNTKSNRMRK